MEGGICGSGLCDRGNDQPGILTLALYRLYTTN